MGFTFTASTREVLEQIVRDPRFKEATNVPTWPLPTLVLLGGIITLYFVSCAAWLNGFIATWLVIPFNGVLLYAIFTPLHDATHRTASGNPKINDLLGTIALMGFIPGLTTRIYRYLHLEHHRYAGDVKRDPDEVFVSARWPWVPFVLAAPDITWVIWYLRVWPSRPASERGWFVSGITLYLLWHLAFLTSAYALEFLLLWLIPQRLGMALVVYFFARIQHPEGVQWEQAPFQTTVHIPTHPTLRWMMLSQSEHHIHHLMPSVPFYRYHDAFKLGQSRLAGQNIPKRGFLTPAKNVELPTPTITSLEQVRVSRVIDLAPGVLGIELHSKKDLPYDAGAHIDVHLKNGLVRQYSLCDPYDRSGRYRIAVKREPEGHGGSKAMHRLQIGDSLTISAPRNNFPLSNETEDAVLIAGGIGITPLWCMAQTLHARQRSFSLTAFARDRFAFADQLEQAPFADRVKVHTANKATDRSQTLRDAISPWHNGRQLYLCGPSDFMTTVIATARSLGWPDDHIASEAFVNPNVQGQDNRPFSVKLVRSGLELHVPANAFLIDVLHQHNIAVPCSCTQGVCGSCVTTVVEGEVDHRDAFLSDVDRQLNQKMTVCVSRASGHALSLDL